MYTLRHVGRRRCFSPPISQWSPPRQHLRTTTTERARWTMKQLYCSHYHTTHAVLFIDCWMNIKKHKDDDDEEEKKRGPFGEEDPISVVTEALKRVAPDGPFLICHAPASLCFISNLRRKERERAKRRRNGFLICVVAGLLLMMTCCCSFNSRHAQWSRRLVTSRARGSISASMR